jgi:hypothetical protein
MQQATVRLLRGENVAGAIQPARLGLAALAALGGAGCEPSDFEMLDLPALAHVIDLIDAGDFFGAVTLRGSQ